ncbi:hypothetical protein SKAU_G00068300 [Synaphobranchus kaupii]|uniref:Uncharacterized protein n=1 Tax=Synaphobranchus kaupii TaxID=118154 RepID=A0A9Q1G7T9_SYNKA|nr:hypothetical protein SKAU_G00068300 [Synaphobranchus kaupii]
MRSSRRRGRFVITAEALGGGCDGGFVESGVQAGERAWEMMRTLAVSAIFKQRAQCAFRLGLAPAGRGGNEVSLRGTGSRPRSGRAPPALLGSENTRRLRRRSKPLIAISDQV